MIQLRHEIDAAKGTLTLIADEEARDGIRELIAEEGTSRDEECAALEHLIGNSELEWIDPADSEDLTDAPILGILGEARHQNSGPCGAMHVGRDAGGNLYMPILERWGYEPYQVRSFLTDLAEKGRAIFINHW